MSFKNYSGRLLIWITLLSLVPQGIPLSVGDRTPILLYFDVIAVVGCSFGYLVTALCGGLFILGVFTWYDVRRALRNVTEMERLS